MLTFGFRACGPLCEDRDVFREEAVPVLKGFQQLFRSFSIRGRHFFRNSPMLSPLARLEGAVVQWAGHTPHIASVRLEFEGGGVLIAYKTSS